MPYSPPLSATPSHSYASPYSTTVQTSGVTTPLPASAPLHLLKPSQPLTSTSNLNLNSKSNAIKENNNNNNQNNTATDSSIINTNMSIQINGLKSPASGSSPSPSAITGTSALSCSTTEGDSSSIISMDSLSPTSPTSPSSYSGPSPYSKDLGSDTMSTKFLHKHRRGLPVRESTNINPAAFSGASTSSSSSASSSPTVKYHNISLPNGVIAATNTSINKTSPDDDKSPTSSFESSSSTSSSSSSISLDESVTADYLGKIKQLHDAVSAISNDISLNLTSNHSHIIESSSNSSGNSSKNHSHNSSAVTIVPTPVTSGSSVTDIHKVHAAKHSHHIIRLNHHEPVSSTLLASKAHGHYPSTPPNELDYSSDDKRPHIVRKKSGELVKSSLKLPSLARPSSMPSTPTKMVHFDTKLEHVRHFLHSERPTAVSAQSSPAEERPRFHWGSEDDGDQTTSETDEDEEDPKLGYSRYIDRTEWKINLPNFPQPSIERQSSMVYVDSVRLTSDKQSLLGNITVKNISYNKYVGVRYTIDFWKTVTELAADYNDDIRRKKKLQGYDRFTFTIKLADLPQHALNTKSLFFCVKYAANGQEFWDNNDTYNYQVDFVRVPKTNGNSTMTVGSFFENNSGKKLHHRRTKSNESVSGSDKSSSAKTLDEPWTPEDRPRRLSDSDIDSPLLLPTSTMKTLKSDSDFDFEIGNATTSRKNTLSPSSYLSDISFGKPITDRAALGNSGNSDPTSRTSSSGGKKSKKFSSRYDFGASLNALSKNSKVATSYDADYESDNESPGSYSPTRPSSTATLTSNGSASATVPSKSPVTGPSPVTTSDSSSTLKRTDSKAKQLALGSMSYQDLLNNYCFFQGPSKPATPVGHPLHASSYTASAISSTSSFAPIPATNPSAVPKSGTPPVPESDKTTASADWKGRFGGNIQQSCYKPEHQTSSPSSQDSSPAEISSWAQGREVPV